MRPSATGPRYGASAAPHPRRRRAPHRHPRTPTGPPHLRERSPHSPGLVGARGFEHYFIDIFNMTMSFVFLGKCSDSRCFSTITEFSPVHGGPLGSTVGVERFWRRRPAPSVWRDPPVPKAKGSSPFGENLSFGDSERLLSFDCVVARRRAPQAGPEPPPPQRRLLPRADRALAVASTSAPRARRARTRSAVARRAPRRRRARRTRAQICQTLSDKSRRPVDVDPHGSSPHSSSS
jgi:hypothetical protein